ncbi:hypothetical protein, partial [Oceaniglobus trochenteri]|uniref:hypothetical protein n=1 Tax=Oceaniglobus trochenteri TaxID=2763260 RepID=UPI001D00066E
DIRHSGETVLDNFNCDGNTSAGPFLLRDCVATIKNAAITDCDSGGIGLQDCYTQGFGVQNVDFDGIADGVDALAPCVHYSRGTHGYIEDCTFGVTTACDVHIQGSRDFRIRARGNTHGSFNRAIFYGSHAPGIFQFDPDEPNDISSCGATNGDTPLLLVPGVYMDGIWEGRQGAGHRYYPLNDDSTWPVTLTGTTRTNMAATNAEIMPFNMPGPWLLSPKAWGQVEYEIDCPVAETVTIQIAGDSSSTSYLLGAITLSPTAATIYKVIFNVSGPLPGNTVGRYSATAIGSDGSSKAEFGVTGNVTNAALSGLSMAAKTTRLYVTRSAGTGNLRILRMPQSEVSA